jgi:hypothetical protein
MLWAIVVSHSGAAMTYTKSIDTLEGRKEYVGTSKGKRDCSVL